MYLDLLIATYIQKDKNENCHYYYLIGLRLKYCVECVYFGIICIQKDTDENSHYYYLIST